MAVCQKQKLPFLRPYLYTFHKVLQKAHKSVYLQSFPVIIKPNPSSGKIKIKA